MDDDLEREASEDDRRTDGGRDIPNAIGSGCGPRWTGQTFVAPYTSVNDNDCFGHCSADRATGRLLFELEPDTETKQFWAAYAGGEAGNGAWVGMVQQYVAPNAAKGQRTFTATIRFDKAVAAGHSRLNYCLYISQASSRVAMTCVRILDGDAGKTDSTGQTIRLETVGSVAPGDIWVEAQLEGTVLWRTGETGPTYVHADATVVSMSIR